MEKIKDSVDCNLYFFDNKVEQWSMYLTLIAAIVIAVGIYILLNLLLQKKQHSRLGR